MWWVFKLQPSKQAPTDDLGPLRLGLVGQGWPPGERAPADAASGRQSLAVSGPVSGETHMAPTPGFSGGVRGRKEPHAWVLELPLPSLEMVLGQLLLPGKEGGVGQPCPQ